MSNVAPIILAQKYNPQMNPALLGNAQRARHAYSKAGRIRHSSTKNYDICLVCPALSVSGVKIAAPIALAQHKGHNKIGAETISPRFTYCSRNRHLISLY
jgi:hypothetical protein